MLKGSFGSCQSPGSRVAALASMSLKPPKPKRQSSADRGGQRQRKHSETKDQQNAQLVVSALDLAVEDRRLAEFRTRCLVQENPPFYRCLFSNSNLRLIFLRQSRSALGRWRGTSQFAISQIFRSRKTGGAATNLGLGEKQFQKIGGSTCSLGFQTFPHNSVILFILRSWEFFSIRRNFRKKNLLNCMFPNIEETLRNGERRSLQARCLTPAGKTKMITLSDQFKFEIFNIPPKQPPRVVPACQPARSPQLQREVSR